MEKDYFYGLTEAVRRSTIIPFIAWAIVVGLALAAALYSAKVAAEEAGTTYSIVGRPKPGDLIRLTLEPCQDAPAWLNLRRAEMRYEGIDYVACWFALGQMVIVLDSNDDATPIPLRNFTKDEAI